ncbi:uncharacterized protein [Nicotiana tomentosiformis]|uniref:uncharacterized protein n=1 Tax=Nicotiana tomentosiformis TaxID=4098 RepID=UPI00388C5663
MHNWHYAKQICSEIGTPLALDVAIGGKTRPSMEKVRVEIDLLKPLVKSVFVRSKTGETDKKEKLINEDGHNSGVQKEEKEGQGKKKQEKHLALEENKKAITTQSQNKGKEKRSKCDYTNEERQVKTQHRLETTQGHYIPENKEGNQTSIKGRTNKRNKKNKSKQKKMKKSKVIFKRAQFQRNTKQDTSSSNSTNQEQTI